MIYPFSRIRLTKTLVKLVSLTGIRLRVIVVVLQLNSDILRHFRVRKLLRRLDVLDDRHGGDKVVTAALESSVR